MLNNLNKFLGEWQYLWFFAILSAELVVSAVTLWWVIKEYNYDRGLVEKKRKPVKPREVVLAPIPDECKHINTRFDRTISLDSEGKEDGMRTRCSDCGIALD